jgi:hypothetical protein
MCLLKHNYVLRVLFESVVYIYEIQNATLCRIKLTISTIYVYVSCKDLSNACFVHTKKICIQLCIGIPKVPTHLQEYNDTEARLASSTLNSIWLK